MTKTTENHLQISSAFRFTLIFKRIYHLLTMSYIVSLISTGPYTIQMHTQFLHSFTYTEESQVCLLLKTPTPNYSTYEGALGGTGRHTHTHAQAKKSCYFKFPEEDIHHYTL